MAGCAHCGAPEPKHRWTVAPCAAGRKKIASELCSKCDLAMNAYVLRFIQHPEAEALIEGYRRKLKLPEERP
jgi:hypothetical protein